MKPKILIIALTFGLMTALILTSCGKCGGIFMMDYFPAPPETISFIIKDSAGGKDLLYDSTLSADDLKLISEFGDSLKPSVDTMQKQAIVGFYEIFGKQNLGLKSYTLEIATDTATLDIPFSFDQKSSGDCPGDESIITFIYIDKYQSKKISKENNPFNIYEIYICKPK